MIRRAIPHALGLVLAAGIGLPSLAVAASGAGGVGSSGGGTVAPGGSQTAAPVAQPGNVTVTASANGITIATTASAILRNGLVVSGSVPAADAGESVLVEIWGTKTNLVWQAVASAQVAADGSFSAVWKTNHIGRFSIRAVVGSASAASASSAPPTVGVTVYRPSVATLYGPGFYGRHTACGVVLRRTTIGVANRTLPCGTPVAIYYQGRTLVVPVIDRGPYAHGADWDLTMATGRALGMSTTATLGAVSLPRGS